MVRRLRYEAAQSEQAICTGCPALSPLVCVCVWGGSMFPHHSSQLQSNTVHCLLLIWGTITSLNWHSHPVIWWGYLQNGTIFCNQTFPSICHFVPGEHCPVGSVSLFSIIPRTTWSLRVASRDSVPPMTRIQLKRQGLRSVFTSFT